MPHKVFGKKEHTIYTDRPGAYLIPLCDDLIGIVKTDKGYFLLGGGKEPGETDHECIIRECLEETGYQASVERYLGSAETYTIHSRIGYFHPIQAYYLGRLLEKKQQPVEQNHELLWYSYEEIKGKMFSEMQNWILDLVFMKGCDFYDASETFCY